MLKRGQAWSFDLMVASIIFSFGIALFFIYTINYPSQGSEKIEILSFNAEFIADSLLSEGVPADWTTGDVERIGLLSDNKINISKYDDFDFLLTTNYDLTKSLFNTRFNYNVTFLNSTLEGLGPSPLNPSNLIRVERFTIFENDPITLVVNVWE